MDRGTRGFLGSAAVMDGKGRSHPPFAGLRSPLLAENRPADPPHPFPVGNQPGCQPHRPAESAPQSGLLARRSRVPGLRPPRAPNRFKQFGRAREGPRRPRTPPGHGRVGGRVGASRTREVARALDSGTPPYVCSAGVIDGEGRSHPPFAGRRSLRDLPHQRQGKSLQHGQRDDFYGYEAAPAP